MCFSNSQAVTDPSSDYQLGGSWFMNVFTQHYTGQQPHPRVLHLSSKLIPSLNGEPAPHNSSHKGPAPTGETQSTWHCKDCLYREVKTGSFTEELHSPTTQTSELAAAAAA